jgi:hypothetical protein
MDSKELRQMSLDNAKLAMEQWEPKDWKDVILSEYPTIDVNTWRLISLDEKQIRFLAKIHNGLGTKEEREWIFPILDAGMYSFEDREKLNALRKKYGTK